MTVYKERVISWILSFLFVVFPAHKLPAIILKKHINITENSCSLDNLILTQSQIDNQVLLTKHNSHSSHASHASHASHYSGTSHGHSSHASHVSSTTSPSSPTYYTPTDDVKKLPNLSASIDYSQLGNNGLIQAGESGNIIITVGNTGNGSSGLMKVTINQISGTKVVFEKDKNITAIMPDQQNSISVILTVPTNSKSGVTEFEVMFFSENGKAPESETFFLHIQAIKVAELSTPLVSINIPNDSPIINDRNMINITLQFSNTGMILARDVRVHWDVSQGGTIASYSNKEQFYKTLFPSEIIYSSIDIEVNSFNSNQLSTTVSIISPDIQKPFIKVIEIPINKTIPKSNNIICLSEDTYFADFETNIPKTKAINKNAIAVVLGVENYSTLPSAQASVRDAYYIKRYFSSALGINENMIYYSYDNDVTLSSFHKLFSKDGWLYKRINSDSEVFVFFAGHGTTSLNSNTPFLLPYDGDANYPEQTGYALSTLITNISNLNIKNATVFIDACFSGISRTSQPLIANARPLVFNATLPTIPANISLMTSTQDNQISCGMDDRRHGIFSYYLLKGLQGRADLNANKKITLQELYDFIKPNVENTALLGDKIQKPQLISNSPNSTIVILP